MYQKFIITRDGVLRFGYVYQHRDLLDWGEESPYGGGLWQKDRRRNAVLLYGRSFAFGAPDFNLVKEVDWSGIGGEPLPLFFISHWPNEDRLVPVCVNAI